MPRPRPSKHRSLRRRLLAIDALEERRLLAANPDFFELNGTSPLYADSYFVEQKFPVQPSSDPSGLKRFDFSIDPAGDQTTDIEQPLEESLGSKLKVDPTKDYFFEIWEQPGEGAILVDTYDAADRHLGSVAIRYATVQQQSLNRFRIDEVTAVVGQSGMPLPENVRWIQPRKSHFRFGFLGDKVYHVHSQRSNDEWLSPVTYPVTTADTYYMNLTQVRHNYQGQTHSFGFVALDADRQTIERVHVQRYANAVDTRLASPLLPGQTTIQLNSATGWSNNSLDPRTRALAWFGYRDATGLLYDDYTYTRNVASDPIDGLWDVGGISGNTITLRQPWAGPALTAGTAVRNAVDGASLIPAGFENDLGGLNTTKAIAGLWQNGKPQAGQFPPGTRFIKLATTMNQTSALVDERISLQLQFGKSGQPNSFVSNAGPFSNRRVGQLDVLANDTGAQGSWRIVSFTQPVHGQVFFSPDDPGRLRYLAASYFIGSDFFNYTVEDSGGNSSTQMVMLRSLGSNLDSDPALKQAVNAESAQVEYDFNWNQNFGVQNQTLVSKLFNENRGQPYHVRLDNIAFGAGALNLKPDGSYRYQPASNTSLNHPLRFSMLRGRDVQPLLGTIQIFPTEFIRDQYRMEQLVLAQHNFESTFKRLFYSSAFPKDASNRPLLSWRVYSLPFIGYTELYNKFKLDEPWDSPHNIKLLDQMPDTFRSGNEGPTSTTTRYQAIAESVYPSPLQFFLNNVDGRNNSKSFSKVTDGTGNTILIVQSGPDKAVPWTKPVDLDFDYGNPLASLGNVGAYFNAGFAGSFTGFAGPFGQNLVHAFPVSIGNTTFRSLATISSGEIIDGETIAHRARIFPDFPGGSTFSSQTLQANRMRAQLLAMHNHESTYKELAPPRSPTVKNLSWRVWLLPYFEQGDLFSQFRHDEPWDSPHNLALAQHMPDIFRSIGDSPDSTTTRFRVLGGAGMAYGGTNSLNKGPKFSDFWDGTYQTILIVEAGTDKAVPWTKPDVMPMDPNAMWASLGQFPGGSMLVGMADGSTLRIPTFAANNLVRGLATINSADEGLTDLRLAIGDGWQSPGNFLSYANLNRMKQIGLAVHNYESSYRLLPNNFQNWPSQLPTSTVGLSWRVAILPYIEESTLYNRFRLNEPWDSPHNLSLLPLMPDLFRTSGDSPTGTTTRIQRFSGARTVSPTQKLKFAQITDGTSNTILAAITAPNKAVPWTKPEDIPFDYGDGWSRIGADYEQTTIALMDGSVRHMYRKDEDVVYPEDWLGQTLSQLVIRDDGIAGGSTLPVSPIVVYEGGIVEAEMLYSYNIPLVLDFDDKIATASIAPDNYMLGLGHGQRITVEALNDRNGK